MKLGDEVRVKIIDYISDTKARVTDVSNENPGILMIKGNLRVLKDGTVNAWVIQHNKKTGEYKYGNAYFGKFSISRAISERYKSILRSLYESPEKITADDISYLKGMCNRCLKKDQWDWFTTYKYLGYPVFPLLREFVKDSVNLRDQIRNGNYDNLSVFRGKYHNLLSSMLFHLSEDIEVDDQDVDIPIPDFDMTLWKRMSIESRKNIITAERLTDKSSLYILMHYFVTLEQEFRIHFIEPFVDSLTKEPSEIECYQDTYKRTHDILLGKVDFTLGTIYFLGKFVSNQQARVNSMAIRMFYEFLGQKTDEFVTICSMISTDSINGIPLPKIRNGLAHGDAAIISNINKSTFIYLRSYLLYPPKHVIKRILLNSMKLI